MGLYEIKKFCSRRFRFLFPRPAPAGREPGRGDSLLVWFRFFSLCGFLRLCARIFVSENPLHPVGNPLPVGVSHAFVLKKILPASLRFLRFLRVNIWVAAFSDGGSGRRPGCSVLLCPKTLHFRQSFSRYSFPLRPCVQILFFLAALRFPRLAFNFPLRL
jgi:hypothetical protein